VQGALNVSGSIATKLGDLFNKTNGVLVAAVMSTIGKSVSDARHDLTDVARDLSHLVDPLRGS
jgi:hypothetical protein